MTIQKHIFITGVTGFLGSELAQRFLMLNYEITVLVHSNNNASAEERVKQLFDKSVYDTAVSNIDAIKLHIVEGDIKQNNLGMDITTYDSLSNSIDEVFHCAAATKFSGIDSSELIKTNHIGTENVLQFCLSGKKKHIHHISTAYVAGRKKGIVYESELNDSHGFNNIYEESKFMAEQSVQNFSLKHGLDFTVYRPTIIVGDSRTGHTLNSDGLSLFTRTLLSIKRRIKNSQQNKDSILKENDNVYIPVRILGNAETTINLVPVDYVINTIMSIFLDRNRSRTTFHIVNPYPPTLSFILESIIDTIKVTGPTIVGTNELQAEGMTSLEKMISKKLDVYNLYMHNEPYFQSKNTMEILNDFCITCPKITKQIISMFVNYLISNNGTNIDNREHKASLQPATTKLLEEVTV